MPVLLAVTLSLSAVPAGFVPICALFSVAALVVFTSAAADFCAAALAVFPLASAALTFSLSACAVSWSPALVVLALLFSVASEPATVMVLMMPSVSALTSSECAFSVPPNEIVFVTFSSVTAPEAPIELPPPQATAPTRFVSTVSILAATLIFP